LSDEDKTKDEEIDLSEVWSSIKNKLGFGKKKKKTKAKKEDESSDEEIEFKNIIKFFKEHKNLMTWLLLAIIIITSTWMRASVIPNFNRLPLDPDSFLFYRYANELAINGYLPEDDNLRYFPQGFKTFMEHQVSSYFVAGLYWLFNGLFQGSEVIDFMIIFPIISFAISMLFFFLMSKELFNSKKAGLIATALLAFVPGYIFRTVTPDKEAMTMVFWYSMIYCLIKAYKAKDIKSVIIYSSISGVLAGLASLSWGGATFLFQGVAGATIVVTLIGRLNSKRMIIFILWSAPLLLMSSFLSLRYGSLIDMAKNQLFIGVYAALLVIAFYKLLYEPLLKNKKIKGIPEPVWMLLCIAVIALPLMIIAQATGLMNVLGTFSSLIDIILHPFGTCPFCVSVSENQAPYFFDPSNQVDWLSRLEWLAPLSIIGSTLLVHNLVKKFKKASVPVIAYTIFLLCFMFSRFSSDPKYAGFNAFMNSIFIYTLPLMIITGFLFYLKHHKSKLWDDAKPEFLMIIIWFIVSVIATRGAIRILFALAPVAALLSAYAIIEGQNLINAKLKDKFYSYAVYAVLIIALISGAQSSINELRSYGSSFTPDWGVAMEWIKLNTPQDAVFTHWWDYGYFVQTMGNRTTNLDGGNFIVEWNEIIGGRLFSAYNLTEALGALNFFSKTMPDGSLKRPDYFLIMDDDILKYIQMANIGGRPTHYSAFLFNQQVKNNLFEPDNYSTLLVFQPIGVGVTGEDFIINNKLFAKESTYIVNVLIPMQNDTFGPPLAYIVNTELNEQLVTPYKCVCEQGVGCRNVLESGINACYYFVQGALISIPADLRDRLMTKLYLLEMNVPGFELVYDSPANLTAQTIISQSDPTDIRIYRINYPELESASAAELGNP